LVEVAWPALGSASALSFPDEWREGLA